MITAVTFQNVSCIISGNKILDDISLTIPQGQITGILGPNGAGKTTLLSLINGLRSHTSGKIMLLDKTLPAKDLSIRQKIGVVLQETALYEELTTFENLRFSASLYGIENATARIIEVLELLHLSDRSDQVVRDLSGGLRRRIAIARAFLHDPELLLIDEPTLGVDVEARHAIWEYLRLLRSKGRTIIVATNYLDEAQALCDTVAVLRQGKLITCESPKILFARAGYCLDIVCSGSDCAKLQSVLKEKDGILRVDKTATGASVFLRSDSVQEKIMGIIMKNIKIESFQMRAPDLAEVFKTL